MTDNMHRAGFLARIGRFFLVTSEAAVSIHYRAPWLRTEAVRPADPVSRAVPGNTCPA